MTWLPGVVAGFQVATVQGFLDNVVRNAMAWLDYWGGRIVLAALVLALGWYVARLVVQMTGRQVARRFRRPSVTKTILRGIRGLILLAAATVAASLLGITGTNILLSVTVFSAVLGLVLAPIIGSYINGVFVLMDQPYEIGDMVELVEWGHQGFVEDITLRYTKVFTLDNTFLVVPNSSIREQNLINHSAEDERSRLTLEVGVTYEGDLEEARAIVEESAREVSEVIESGPDIRIGSARYPASPVTYIKEFGDNGVVLTLRYWVKNPYRIPAVQSKVQERIWNRLDDADVSIPYPHSHLVFDDTSGRAQVTVDAPGETVDGRATQRRPGQEREQER